jgi:PBP1b-binding outer membrane lipoprotein LpoB
MKVYIIGMVMALLFSGCASKKLEANTNPCNQYTIHYLSDVG